MKIKNYPKVYEDVFSSKRALGKLKFDQITIRNDEPVELWGNKLRELVRENELRQFDFLVKFNWMVRGFKRSGVAWKPNRSSGTSVAGSIGVWAKNYGNFHFLSVTNNYIYKKIFTYFDDFFPDFELGDPFKNKYEYPYKYMGFSHLVLVYQMPERMGLLEYGEDQKMSYAKFSDYILNYILCFNEEHGETYLFKFSTFFLPYVKAINSKIYEKQSRGYRDSNSYTKKA
jgi:hypothetical protein